jgi:hypothetical protein
MKLQRRGFLHLAAGAVAMSGLPRLALALDPCRASSVGSHKRGASSLRAAAEQLFTKQNERSHP